MKTVCMCCHLRAVSSKLPVCGRCLPLFQLLLTQKCPNCGKSAGSCICSENDNVRFLFFFGDKTSVGIINYIKYNKNRYAVRFIAELLVAERGLASGSYDAVTYVPRKRRRVAEAGYDQAKAIAKEISNIIGVPCVKLLKNTGGKEQKLLSRSERERNINGRFCFIGKQNSFKSVLLIDDVSTTGATVSVCKKILKDNGIDRVSAAVIAKTVLK